MPSFGQDSLFHFLTSAMLFLKLKKLLVKSKGLLFWDVVNSISKKYLCSLVLSIANFELCKLNEEVLIESFVAEFS